MFLIENNSQCKVVRFAVLLDVLTFLVSIAILRKLNDDDVCIACFWGSASAASDARSFIGGHRGSTCRQYAVLTDDGRPGELQTLCGGSQRVTDAYLSTGSTLQVRITAGLAPNDFQRFVIAYTGTLRIQTWTLSGQFIERAGSGFGLSDLGKVCADDDKRTIRLLIVGYLPTIY